MSARSHMALASAGTQPLFRLRAREALRREERDWGRGALASTLSPVSKRFRAPAGARVTFSLNGQRESNPRERPPRWRALRPSMGYGCAGGLRGFPTAPPCADGKLARIHSGHPADFPPPARRAIGAPGKAARSCAQKQRQRQRHPTPAVPCEQGREMAWARCLALTSALASGAHDVRLLFRGPSATVSRGREGRAAGAPMDGLAFSRGQEPARKARPRLTDFPPREGRKATPRGVVFSWLLLFWTSKREVARAAAAARNRSETCRSAKAKGPLTPTLSPNAVGGEGDSARQHVARTPTGAQP
jgi:hypothetical protein